MKILKVYVGFHGHVVYMVGDRHVRSNYSGKIEFSDRKPGRAPAASRRHIPAGGWVPRSRHV